MEVIELDNAEFLSNVCQLINEGHTVSIRVKGYSMWPFIESDRDAVTLGAIKGDLKVGDVVLAEIRPDMYVLHRIDAIQGNHVRLRGDGNVGQTEQCGKEDVRAIALQIIRKGKTWNVTSRTWRLYSYLWVHLLPIRCYLLAIYRRVFISVK